MLMSLWSRCFGPSCIHLQPIDGTSTFPPAYAYTNATKPPHHTNLSLTATDRIHVNLNSFRSLSLTVTQYLHVLIQT